MKMVAQILLVSNTGSLLMQRRDDKPGIANPGKITAFGGMAEGDETPRQAALRELEEETNLRPPADALRPFATFKKHVPGQDAPDEIHYFILEDIDAASLQVFEGQGFVEVTRQNAASWLFSDLAKQVVDHWFKKGFQK